VIRRLLSFLLKGRPVRLPTDPIPGAWPSIVERCVPLSRHLDAAERERLLRLTQLFLRDVPLEGCAGLELTDEIRVTIAATACLLLLHLPYPRFPHLRRVLVYPETFVPIRIASHRSLAPQPEPEPTLGEAWKDGMVVLSWDSVRASASRGDGHNVVLHEFAHVLDFEDGVADGRPLLGSLVLVEKWSATLAATFAQQQEAVEQAADTALDPYAATDRAEFFAVATETFFAAGTLLQARLPELYEQLQLFYRQDPAAWGRHAARPNG
jgi:Mlc titration factor MtfA (ptsG expression regulator)